MCNRCCNTDTEKLKAIGYRVVVTGYSYKVFYGEREIAGNRNFQPNSKTAAQLRAWSLASEHADKLSLQLKLDTFAGART